MVVRITAENLGKAIKRYKGDPAYAPGQERDGKLICGAKKRGKDEACGSSPVPGGVRCGRHGGNSPKAKAAAEGRIAEQELNHAIGTLGIQEKYPDVDPAQALLQEIRISHAHVQWLRTKVAEVEPNELVWGITKTEVGIGAQGPVDMTVQEAGFSTWYRIYLTEREHFAKLTTMALKAGIEQWRIELEEQKAELVVVALKQIFAQLNLSKIQADMLPTIVPNALRQLTGGTP
ncbi:hypothetical protein [Glutamicibacter sp.]|uniref:hypothetical protein n=1 Tax=Glutamicibacter sp. TaxID=1931995 RepID=UPI002FE1F06D